MITIVIEDGRMGAIVDGTPQAAELLQACGFDGPRRASHVEPVPGTWLWHVDFSPLGEEHQFCLWPARDSREQALEDERRWLEANWLKQHGKST